MPNERELSADGSFRAEVVVPVSEGLIQATGLSGATFDGIQFEHSAFSFGASGFVDLQDGIHGIGNGSNAAVPGAFACENCSDVTVQRCGFRQLGGSAVDFGGVAKRCVVDSTTIDDTACSGVQISAMTCGDCRSVNCSDETIQPTGNKVVNTSITRAGREFSGCVAFAAGCNVGLLATHNTLRDLPYGGFSVGCGAAYAGFARDNVISWNRIERWMLQMQDSAGVYMSGVQPNSTVHHNYIARKGLTGLEPRPTCDAPLAGPPRRCSAAQVLAVEDLWIRGLRACSKYNACSCSRTSPRGFCNQTGNAHGGGIYPDNGSAGWRAFANVLEDVYHALFIWDSKKMMNMSFVGSWTDSLLFTNNAAKHRVVIDGNVFVNRSAGEAWPKEAQAVVDGAGTEADAEGAKE